MDTDIKKVRHGVLSSRLFSRISKKSYKQYLSRLTFFAGFLLDTLTLPRIDVSIVHILIFTYLSIAGLSIFLIQFFIAHTPRSSRLASFLPYVTQFTFGALLSALFLYYFRSASFAGSWFFLLLLGGISIGNEFLRTRYRLLEFQLSIFFAILFAFMIFYVPIIFKHIGVDTFIIAGVVSLTTTVLLILLVLRVVSRHDRGGVRQKLFLWIGVSYLLFNVLYFSNIIPPIPLVLKHAAAYHFVTRDAEGVYVVRDEPRRWFEEYIDLSPTYHHVSGERIYFFSAVFAPAELKTSLVHEWQYFDAKNDAWVTKEEIVFPVIGGREEGYRAYSLKDNIIPGKWRVVVRTERGAVLGRESFIVVDVHTPFPLSEYALKY